MVVWKRHIWNQLLKHSESCAVKSWPKLNQAACDFDVKKLPIRLPEFYEECLKCFAVISVGSKMKKRSDEE